MAEHWTLLLKKLHYLLKKKQLKILGGDSYAFFYFWPHMIAQVIEALARPRGTWEQSDLSLQLKTLKCKMEFNKINSQLLHSCAVHPMSIRTHPWKLLIAVGVKPNAIRFTPLAIFNFNLNLKYLRTEDKTFLGAYDCRALVLQQLYRRNQIYSISHLYSLAISRSQNKIQELALFCPSGKYV